MIDQLKQDKKRLGEELSKMKNKASEENAEERCLKLTNIIKLRTKEGKQHLEENWSLKGNLGKLQIEINAANSKIAD